MLEQGLEPSSYLSDCIDFLSLVLSADPFDLFTTYIIGNKFLSILLHELTHLVSGNLWFKMRNRDLISLRSM